jgi:DNA-binding LacI/PurR family transcriptional regulator
VQHLAALRHVRVAYISGPAHLKTAEMRKAAFQECMEEIGFDVFPELLVEGDHTMESGMRAISQLAALPDRPSAVMCSNDMTAIGVMRRAFDLSLSIPQDLSIVGFDDIRLAQFVIPPLTTVQMSQCEIAGVAFRALFDALECPPKEPMRELDEIKTNLVLRCSTALVSDRPGRNGGCKPSAAQFEEKNRAAVPAGLG